MKKHVLNLIGLAALILSTAVVLPAQPVFPFGPRAFGPPSANCDPLDENQYCVKDDFFTGATGTAGNGSYGELGWGRLVIASGCQNFNMIPGTGPNRSLIQLRTSNPTVVNGGCVLYPLGLGTGMLGRLDNVAEWEAKWIFRLTTTTDVRWRIGLCGDNNVGTDEPDNFMGVRFDTNATYNDDGTGNFRVVTRANDVVTATEAAAANTSFHKLHMWTETDVPGTIFFSLDNNQNPVSHTTNVPSDEMGPCVHFTMDTGSGGFTDFEVDYFGFRMVLGRQ